MRAFGFLCRGSLGHADRVARSVLAAGSTSLATAVLIVVFLPEWWTLLALPLWLVFVDSAVTFLRVATIAGDALYLWRLQWRYEYRQWLLLTILMVTASLTCALALIGWWKLLTVANAVGTYWAFTKLRAKGTALKELRQQQSS